MAKKLDMLSKSLQENLDLTAFSQVGHTHNYAGSSTVGGAATSATKLVTARTINGTSFDGSGNITTANWGTARSLTIGNSSKSVNGSENVSWTLTEIGAAPTSHTHSYAGSSSVGGAANSVKTNLMIKLNGGTTEGTNLFTFNGSTAKTVNITPSGIGAAASSHGTHVTYSTTTPKVAGTATVGSESAVARGDHVHPVQTSVSGNAGTATKLATERTIQIGNKSNTFDGSANITYTLADIGALALTGGTLSGRLTADGKITLPTTGSSWISGMTTSNASIEIKTKQSASSYHPILAVKTASDHVANIGGLGNEFGFYGFKSDRTANATDWSFKVDAASGNWTMTGSLTSGGSIAPSNAGTTNLGSAAKPWSAAYADHFQVYGEASKQYGFLGAVTTGTTSTTGETRLVLGNSTATGTANNSYGRIYMYGTSSGYTALTPGNNTTSNITLTLPSGGGTLARTSDNVASATKLQNAKSIQIGNKSNSFDGSANITYTLAEIGAAASNHSHSAIVMNNCSNKDLNTIKTAGWYYGYTGMTNAPVQSISVLEVIVYSADWIVQRFTVINANGITYERHYHSGTTWSDWKTLYDSKNKPTPADIGAAAESHGTHVTYATATPKAHGTAAVGTSAKVAREDHVHPLQTTVSGNAGTATKLANARTLTIGSTGKTFDGSANVSWTLAEIGAAASSHSHTSINYQDTRAVNTAAKDVPNGLSVHLKSNGTDGISDGGSYHPVLMMKPWNDKSGWPVGQLAVTQNNNLYFRVSSGADDTSWNAWKKVSLDGHTHDTGGTVTAVNSNLSSVTISGYDSIMSSINTNINNLG